MSAVITGGGGSSVSNNALTEREEESSNAGSYGYGTERSECGEDKGGCEQICDDTSGRATCLCYRGYVVAQDGVSCTGRVAISSFPSSCRRDFFFFFFYRYIKQQKRESTKQERVAIRYKNSSIPILPRSGKYFFFFLFFKKQKKEKKEKLVVVT